MNVLVTGGAGYIGSHTCVELLRAGHGLVVIDNFSNSVPEALRRVKSITGKTFPVIHGDVRNESLLRHTLERHGCEAVIHFAGKKAVCESVKQPLIYFENNVEGTLCLLRAMRATGVSSLVFSSSATVYGEPKHLPLAEEHPLSPTTPYGRTKLIIEDILRDLFNAEPHWKIGILRYFNPAGAHDSGLIGEDPLGPPNNLMPVVAQVAAGRRERLNVWGNDYPTHDGTGVRDFIHVTDLAIGHLRALDRLISPQCFAVNLGCGVGYSVLDVINAFQRACGRKVPYQFMPRRLGDVATCYSDPARAMELLGWKAERDLAAMCSSAWKWQQRNPSGFAPVPENITVTDN